MTVAKEGGAHEFLPLFISSHQHYHCLSIFLRGGHGGESKGGQRR